MATAALVSHDIDVGRRIVAALTRASIPVTVYLWAFIPQLQEWQFMIATPLVDSKGPRAAYGEVNRALQKEGILDDLPLRRIFLRSPSDKVLKFLEKESKAAPQEAFRVVNERIAGDFVEDAYLYTGSIDIYSVKSAGSAEEKFLVIYIPVPGGGVAREVPVWGVERLRDFLAKDIGIDRKSVEQAIKDFPTKEHITIPNLTLKRSKLERLGLA
ncbi:MAG: hypothetical protein ABR908_01780 [Terriglobales bacterium]|jgi:hypothetical protein